MKYSEQEIMKLEGRELDEAVAVWVMGWESRTPLDRPDYWVRENTKTKSPHYHHAATKGYWHPSTNIAQAYEAIQHVKENFFSIDISIEGTVDRWDHVSINWNGYADDTVRVKGQGSLTELICRALLLWKLRASK